MYFYSTQARIDIDQGVNKRYYPNWVICCVFKGKLDRFISKFQRRVRYGMIERLSKAS